MQYDLADGITLYHGDALEILPTLGIGTAAALVSDPPYGISYKSHLQNAIEYRPIAGDDQPFDPSHLLGYDEVILWGGNNFADCLPIGGWICWDKRIVPSADRILGSPFELAWCKNPKLYKIFRVMHGGAVNDDGGKRYHPTQKPIRLMRECIRLTKSQTIIDPYAGSGSTGIAALLEGRNCIMVEQDAGYCDTIRARIERADGREAGSLTAMHAAGLFE